MAWHKILLVSGILAANSLFPAWAEESADGYTLPEILERTRAANLDVLFARSRLQEADGAFQSARSDMLPDIKGTVMQTRQTRAVGAFGLPESTVVEAPDPLRANIDYNTSRRLVDRLNLPTEATVTFPDPIDLDIDYDDTSETYNWFNAKLRVSVPLLNVGEYREFQAASQGRQRALMDVRAAEQMAMNQAGALYLQILLAQASITTLQQRIELQEQRLALVVDQQAAGSATDLNVLREQQLLSTLKSDLVSAENAERMTLRELKNHLNLGEDEEFAVAGRLDFVPFTLPDRQRALERALEHRADYLSLREREAIARHQRDAARAKSYPSISGMGSFGYEGNEYSDTVDTWMIGAVMSVPIWDFNGRKGHLLQRASMLDQASNRAEDLRLNIINEVMGTFDAVDLTASAVDLGQGGVHLALENLRYRQDQLKAGMADPLEVNNAEVELAMALLKEQESLYNYSLASLRFWAALGDVEFHLDPRSVDLTESTTTPGPSQTGTPD